jgi:dTDP-4-dehydrorhamnose reductase
VDECESNPDHAFLVNALGAKNVALAAAACGAGILAMSTDYVFDGNSRIPYREHDVAEPGTVYGTSKWAGEQAVREVHPRHVIVRSAWLYGRGGTNFIDTVLRKARAGEHLKVVDDQRGSPTWAQDLAAGLVTLAAAGQCGTYHVTSSGDCTWYDLAAHVIARAGLGATLERTTTEALARPARRPAYTVLHNQFYEHVTGSRMPHWQDAADRYLKTRLSHASAGAGTGGETR